MTTDVNVELRGPVSKRVVDVLDAVALAGGESRMAVVNRVLEKWAQGRVHEATLITRVTQGNGSPAEEVGRGAE